MTIVKVYRVFPSNQHKTVSSQLIQFHNINTGDSGEVVTPFMHVGTYPTRYFATLGPLRLQPPFIETYNISQLTNKYFILQHWAGVKLYTSSYKFAES